MQVNKSEVLRVCVLPVCRCPAAIVPSFVACKLASPNACSSSIASSSQVFNSGCPSGENCAKGLVFFLFRSRLRSLFHGGRLIAEAGNLSSQRDGPGVLLRSALRQRHGMPRSRQCCSSSCGGNGHCVPPFNFSLCVQQTICPAAQFERAGRQRLNPAMRWNEILCPPVQSKRTRLLVRRSPAGH